MRVIRHLGLVPAPLPGVVVTLGNFDGVHLGHQAIVRRVVEEARDRGGQAVVVTFHPHPVAVLKPEHAPPRIQSLHDRLATLRDLAADPDFRGLVVCDIDGAGFAAPSLDMQKPEVDYYHREFSPSRAAHRLLLNHWQLNAAIARSDFSLLRSAVRWWNGEGEPFRPYQWLDRRRFGHIDYDRGDTEAQKRELAANLERFGGHLPRIPFNEWWPQVENANAWVRAIQARGGDVIFYASPTSGQRRWAEGDWFPRAEYWDKMAAATTAKTLFSLDVAALRDFPLPDDSHIDYRQKPAYTNALIDALIERGWVTTAAANNSDAVLAEQPQSLVPGT